jgi:23S rRNA (adenine2503-C2)-methyltransferase
MVSRRVLVVDDDKSIRHLCKEYLEEMGHETHLASSAEDALRKEIAKMDLFVVDIHMPGENGIELIGRLRKMGIQKPIIIMTSLEIGENLMKADSLGVAYFLRKPFSESTFKSAVKKAEMVLDRILYAEGDESGGVQKYVMPIKINDGKIFIEFASFLDRQEKDPRQKKVVCLTCQIGCSSGCLFCCSGCVYQGKVENIGLKDMQFQASAAKDFHGWTKPYLHVFFGGSGEPMVNPAVADFIESADDQYTFRISTVGITKPFRNFVEKFGENKKILQLQISLHFPEDGLRNQHIKIAEKNSIKEILKIAEIFAEKNGAKVCLNYALFRGINDSDEMIRKLASLAKNRPFFVRLSQANPFGSYQQTSKERIDMAKTILTETGVQFKLFISRGTKIKAGCGQLIARLFSHQNQEI